MAYRVLTYSHDSCGLGHLRRTLLIGQRLLERIPDLSVLSVIGSPSDHCFPRAHRKGLDLLKLPCVEKTSIGTFRPRYLNGPLPNLISLRRRILTETIKDYQPHVVIADKWPGGMMAELEPALEWCRASGAPTKWVLSLRDILDSPENVIAEWHESRSYEYLEKYYAEIWVFGQPEICNVPREYGFSELLARKTSFLGYLTPSELDDIRHDTSWNEEPSLEHIPKILITTGGGADGFPMIDQVLRAYRAFGPGRLRLSIIRGPMMPDEECDQLSRSLEDLDLVETFDYTTHMPEFIRKCSAVISMGGYNTLREVIHHRKPLLVIPRLHPRREQAIRAHAFEKLGLCRVASGKDNAQATILKFFEDVVSGAARLASDSLQFGAEEALCARTNHLLERSRNETRASHEAASV